MLIRDRVLGAFCNYGLKKSESYHMDWVYFVLWQMGFVSTSK